MSKQSEAKIKQGWCKKFAQVCGNCKHFTSDKTQISKFYTRETDLRCGLGGFKTGKSSTCNEWKGYNSET